MSLSKFAGWRCVTIPAILDSPIFIILMAHTNVDVGLYSATHDAYNEKNWRGKSTMDANWYNIFFWFAQWEIAVLAIDNIFCILNLTFYLLLYTSNLNDTKTLLLISAFTFGLNQFSFSYANSMCSSKSN